LLLEDYKLKIEYLTAHFDRMWKRFQIFVGIQSALFAFYFQFLFTADGKRLQPNAWLFAVLGFSSALMVAFFGAQDRYLVQRYRDAVKEAGVKLWHIHATGGGPTERYSSVGEVEPSGEGRTSKGNGHEEQRTWWERQRVRSPVEFHSTFASPTMLPAIFGYATAVLWLLTLVFFASID
jgi:hypothetical protein